MYDAFKVSFVTCLNVQLVHGHWQHRLGDVGLLVLK